MMLTNNTDNFTYLMRTMIHAPQVWGKKVLAELLTIFEQMPPDYQRLTEAVQDIYARPVKISCKLVWDYCRTRSWFDLELLLRNIQQNDICVQWEWNLKQVMSEAKRARIAQAISRIDLTAPLDELTKSLGDLSKLSKYDDSFFADLGETKKEIYEGKKIPRITTGFRGLDHALDGGLPVGDVSVIAGSTGSGKSTLAYNIALNALKAGDAHVTIYSLEMTARDVFARMVAMDTGIDARHIGGCDRTRKSSDFLEKAYLDGDFKIRANTTNLHQIRNQAVIDSKWGTKKKLLIVDYTGLVKHDSKNSYERMSEISVELRQIALDSNSAVLEVVQFNREYKKANDLHAESRPPVLTDLRDSGQIEQDASVILMLHDPKKQDLTDEQWKPKDLFIRKNRHGRNDFAFALEFNGSAYQFKERF